MPPIVLELAAKYGGKALAILVILLTLTAGYFYWKHEVATEARDKAIADCNESKEKFRIDAEHFKLAKQDEINKLNEQQAERVKNAIQTYVSHYESLRNTAVASSLRVKTSSTGAGCSAVPGTGEDRSKSSQGITGIGESELSSGNLRQLNEVISSIENLELKCEKLLNTLP